MKELKDNQLGGRNQIPSEVEVVFHGHECLAWCSEPINIKIKRENKIEVEVMIIYLENDL